MKTFILSIIVTMITSVAGAQQKSFYDFTVKAIDGKDLPLSTFKGKKVLVVNVASKCGFTPQYAKLEELYEKYGKDDVEVPPDESGGGFDGNVSDWDDETNVELPVG